MQLEYTQILIEGIPINPPAFVDLITTDQRVIGDGTHIEFMNITDKYFKSVDFPLSSQKHKIQSKVSDKYYLTVYAKEAINIDSLKYGSKITVITQDSSKINGIILDVSKESISPSFNYKYKITFYNLNLDVFSINNYLTSDYLLQQPYASDLVKFVATGNKGIYTNYFVQGTSTLPDTNTFQPFYYYFGEVLKLVIPNNAITSTLRNLSLTVDATNIKSSNVEFDSFAPAIWNNNWIILQRFGLGFVADEVSLTWEATNAINLIYYTKLLPTISSIDVKEKKSEITGIDIVNSSMNNSVCNTRFYLNREDTNNARNLIPRCDLRNGGTVYVEYNGQRYYSYERVLPEIPKKEDLIDIFEVNLNINFGLNNYNNFV
jgi:hypothetical protein